jgi:hypothetical protein
MSKSVLIANPIGSRFTSKTSADRFVRRGEAKYLPDASLLFIEQNQGQRVLDQHARQADRGPRSIFSWTGAKNCDGRCTEAQSRPGVFRS